MLLTTSVPWLSSTPSWISRRFFAISVKPPKVLPGKRLPRVFKDKKAFQYNWYMKILLSNAESALVFLRHNDFSAQKLVKLRADIKVAASRVKPSLASPVPSPITTVPESYLTIIRSSIFGAALRDFQGLDLESIDRIAGQTKGGLAVLSLPTFNPPQLNAILRTLDRSVPPRKPKTEEELKKELEAKNADPATPGRRMKRQRPILQPELEVVGALIDGRVFFPEDVRDISNLPTLETLRAQIVGLLSAPGVQLAAVLNQAGGGRLARTLEGLKKGLEETQESETTEA